LPMASLATLNDITRRTPPSTSGPSPSIQKLWSFESAEYLRLKRFSLFAPPLPGLIGGSGK
jgi:hypothetical protein